MNEIEKLSKGLFDRLPDNCPQVTQSAVDTALNWIDYLGSQVAFLDEVKRLTDLDATKGHGKNHLLRALIQEVGEWAEADDVECGVRSKPLKEPAKGEAVDVVICALALFYVSGGTNQELVEYGLQKLKKWEESRKSNA